MKSHMFVTKGIIIFNDLVFMVDPYALVLMALLNDVVVALRSFFNVS